VSGRGGCAWLALACAAALLSPGWGRADVYLWRDAAGELRYSDGGQPRAVEAATRLRTEPKFECDFSRPMQQCGLRLQARTDGRSGLVNANALGRPALRLRTEPGDDHIVGSGPMERTDVYLSQEDTGCAQGREQWWEHSLLFPDDFAMPTWQMYVVFDFHNTGEGPQANFHLNFAPQADLTRPGNLIFRGYGGSAANNWGEYKAVIGPVRKDTWYDFAYFVRWSAGEDGFIEGWVNGEHKLSHHGPTLYAGQGCYLKLANYHTPVCNPYPGCTGPASSVMHGPVRREDVVEVVPSRNGLSSK
jgi:hypothetical protein